jgi:glycosyltransferase involved in cell wall biosynthesis
MRVDVVIPAFNAQLYVQEALESVMAQRPWVNRIIVVDDGSGDATAAIASAFDAPLELIRLPVNVGAAAARNQGVARCTAEFVAFLDADDRWLPGKLAAQVAALTVAPESAFALCQIRPFADAPLPDDERAALLAQQPAEFEGWLPSALLARRQLFAQTGRFAEELRVGEVVDWFARARPFGHVMVPEVLVERRMHRHNTSRLAQEQRRDYLLAAHRHLARQRAAGGGGDRR